MHILLVNDDGIQSTGIRALCVAAMARGHRVSMVAPRSQQSAASQRITLIEPIYVHPCETGVDNVTAFAISGTPADCVRLALDDLVNDPIDLCISGINDGYNAGMAIHYSGTVGAATEAALAGLHAMAVSVNRHATQAMYDALAEHAVRLAERYVDFPAPPVTVFNINAPRCPLSEAKGHVVAPLSTCGFRDRYLRRESPRCGTYYWLSEGTNTELPAAGSDLDMLRKGYVTYTLIGNPGEHNEGLAHLIETIQ